MSESNQEKSKEYTNGEITVVWKPDVCIHAGNCARGLQEVFNPQQRPWINIKGADSEQIRQQINKCPSGALSFYNNDKNQPEQPKIDTIDKGKVAHKEPAKVELEAGKNYAWCTCGLSENQPFCDGAHKGTGMTPNVFKVDPGKTAYLCQCKQTGNSPYCDGTHNNL